MQAFSKPGVVMLALLAAPLAGWYPASAQVVPRSMPPRQSQSQAAMQFLQAVLRADYAAAYQRLAPEVRHTVGLGQFEAAARPLWKSGQKHHQAIELYKLGVRLSEGAASRLFYSFSFAADSLVKPQPVLLEVTFRDTTARSILGFGLRPAGPAKPVKPTGQAPKQKAKH